MTAKKLKAPRLKTSRRIVRGDDGGLRYQETRGLRKIDIPLSGPEKPGSPDPTSHAKHLQGIAAELLKRAGEKTVQQIVAEAIDGIENNLSRRSNAALHSWVLQISLKYGQFSPVTLATKMLAITHSLNIGLSEFLISDDGTDEGGYKKAQDQLNALMAQVYAFADNWHWWHMEWHGEHERAFANVEYAARQAKGSQTSAHKGAQRTAIIRAAIDALRASGKVDMTKISAIAKAIKPAVDHECTEARLPVSVGAAAFEKLVGNVIKAVRKG